MGGVIALIAYIFFAVIVGCVAYLVIKLAVKHGVEEALLGLHLVDKAAIRTIDIENKQNGEDSDAGKRYM